MSTALLIIDFQSTVFDNPAAFECDAVMTRIAALIAAARAVGAPVLYVQHGENDGDWQVGSDGWQFPAAIAPQDGEYISPKSICDAFEYSTLAAQLTNLKIDELVVCGYATEFCIDTNVRRAASMGIAVVIAADAHTTRDRRHMRAKQIIAHHNWIWRNFGGIELRDSAAIVFGRD